jgi:hypothetical protein
MSSEVTKIHSQQHSTLPYPTASLCVFNFHHNPSPPNISITTKIIMALPLDHNNDAWKGACSDIVVSSPPIKGFVGQSNDLLHNHQSSLELVISWIVGELGRFCRSHQTRSETPSSCCEKHTAVFLTGACSLTPKAHPTHSKSAPSVIIWASCTYMFFNAKRHQCDQCS